MNAEYSGHTTDVEERFEVRSARYSEQSEPYRSCDVMPQWGDGVGRSARQGRSLGSLRPCPPPPPPPRAATTMGHFIETSGQSSDGRTIASCDTGGGSQ